MKFSPHFSREEIERSETASRFGIANLIPEAQLPVWTEACRELLEPLRSLLKKPIFIRSGYRSPKVNQKVGGSENSQHRGFFVPKGGATARPCCAFDLVLADANHNQPPNLYLFRTIIEALQELPVDQMIWEFGNTEPDWVHVSYVPKPQKTRREALRARRSADGTVYEKIA